MHHAFYISVVFVLLALNTGCQSCIDGLESTKAYTYNSFCGNGCLGHKHGTTLAPIYATPAPVVQYVQPQVAPCPAPVQVVQAQPAAICQPIQCCPQTVCCPTNCCVSGGEAGFIGDNCCGASGSISGGTIVNEGTIIREGATFSNEGSTRPSLVRPEVAPLGSGR